MQVRSYLKSYAIRHGFSNAIAVFIALWISELFSLSGEYWIVLAAFLVTQTTRGTPLRQGIYFFALMCLSLFTAFIILRYSPSIELTYVILTLVIIIAGLIIFYQQPLILIAFYRILFCVLIVLLAVLYSDAPFKARFIDLTIGTVIGIFCSSVIVPVKLEQEFSEGLIPVLVMLQTYSQTITQVILAKEKPEVLIQLRSKLDLLLQTQLGGYPEWVYETGFNPSLRAGFRFFLVHLDRVIELFFSLQYHALKKLPTDLLLKIQDAFSVALQKNEELLAVLLHYFSKQEITKSTSDFTSDITALEQALTAVIPGSIELLDISPDYISLTGFVRDIKDMRGVLLQLVMALPNEGSINVAQHNHQ